MELILQKLEEEKKYAAEYLRMSTEHQRYSPDNQSAFIHQYAKQRDITIIHTYKDFGKSGLNLSGRAGLQALMDDIAQQRIKISAILLYDVSRFGRFQDPDEAGYYSHLIKKHGVKIIYCAEPFSDEHPEMHMLGLSFSRSGAASYSRNLSEKVFLGQANLIRRGFHQGGMAGYGLRRMLIDENYTEKGILTFGQRKSIQTDRVILIPGPSNEVDIVNRIFDMFNNEGKPELVIASELNRLNILAENNQEWSRGKIHQILTNEKYIGNNVYNKTSFKLKQKYTINPEEKWIRCDGAYEPIVSLEKFNLAKEIIKNRSIVFTDDELLEKLRALYLRKGRLSGIIIDEEEQLPSSSIYRTRFGGLLRAYHLVDYQPEIDYSWLKTNQDLNDFNTKTSKDIIKNIYHAGGWVSDMDSMGLFRVNDEFNLSIQTARCKKMQSQRFRWELRFSSFDSSDINIAIRMNSLNKAAIDYYIFPSIDIFRQKIQLKETNPWMFELYNFPDLSPLYQIIKRVNLQDNIYEK
ncbi:recombinase family protein [Providencia manganoxydans]|uniref:recombinase family protein n=1 Tax=Providencia manganoxydans TaxID=2923283 RepID=UPI0034E48FB6